MTTFRSFEKVQKALLNNTTNCVSISQSYLDEIESNKHLNAFIEVYTDEALSQAKLVDEKLRNGTCHNKRFMICYDNKRNKMV